MTMESWNRGGADVEMYCAGALYTTVAVALNLCFYDNVNKMTA